MSKATSQRKIKSAITAKGNIIYFYIAGKLFIKRYLHLTCYFQNLSKLYLSSHYVLILNFNEPQSILRSFFFFFLINAAGWIILSLKSKYTDKDLPAYTYKGSYLSC